MQERRKPRPVNMLLISVGTILTSMIASGFLLGFAVDYWLDTQPWFMMLLGLLGFIGGLIKVYKLLTHPGMF